MQKVCDIVLSAFSHEPALRLAPMTLPGGTVGGRRRPLVAVAMQNFGAIKDRLDKVKRALVDKRF